MTDLRTEAIPLVDGSTLRLTVAEPVGSIRGGIVVLHEARGVTDQLPVRRPPASREAKLVGRGDELAALEALFERVKDERAPHLVTLLGREVGS